MTYAMLTLAPHWALPLLALLALVGIRALRARRAHVVPLYLLPLLGLLAWPAATALDNPGAPLVFAALYLMGGLSGYRYQGGVLRAKTGLHLRLRAERATLTVLMGLYAAIVWGPALPGAVPVLARGPAYALVLAGLLGALSGVLTGRAWRTLVTPQLSRLKDGVPGQLARDRG